MRKLSISVCCVLVVTSLAMAKNKLESQWTCGKPSDTHSIEIGDQEHHSYAVTQTTCTPTKAGTNVLKEKEGVGTQYGETTGGLTTSHGVFVVTTEAGDKIYYAYESVGAGVVKDGLFQTGNNKWTFAGGTGKFAGAKGTGTCHGKGSADGTVVWDCTGSYVLAK